MSLRAALTYYFLLFIKKTVMCVILTLLHLHQQSYINLYCPLQAT